MSTTLALYQIESTLQQLFEVRDQAEIDGDSEALKVIDAQIDEYLSREVRKVVSVASAIRFCDSQAELARAEAVRVYEHAKAWEVRRDRIKASALRAMQTFNVRVLETPTNKLRVQGNGGLQAIEIDPTVEVAPEYQDVEVRMPASVWLKLCEEEEPDNWRVLWIPNHGRIREALKRGESVPGAKLLPRGEHLRVE